MRRAVLRVLMLGLWRDRGALAMGFVLPVLVFLVFAAIFSGTSGDALRLRVAVADEARSLLSGRLTAAIARDPGLRVLEPDRALDADGVAALVSAGTVDAGIVIRRDGRALDDLAGDGPAPVVVLAHPARAVAGRIVGGLIQRIYGAALPDAALRGAVRLVDELLVELTDAQRQMADAQLGELAAGVSEAGPEAGGRAGLDRLVDLTMSGGGTGTPDQAAYYAGAVAALFVLLSAVQAASSIHDDVTAGILDRVLAGPAGVRALVDGRGVFLVAQGTLQAAVIFGVAWALFAVPLPRLILPWTAVTLALAVSAAGLTLAMATAAQTARQAHAVSHVVILLVSAVGGSMVPRFLMPPWLQQVGWASPNAWAITGYGSVFSGAPDGSLGWLLPVVVLLTAGAVGWCLARWLAARWETT